MGYYIRVLSKQRLPVQLSEIRHALEAERLRATVVVDDESDSDWEAVALAHLDGDEFAAIERNAVIPGSLGAEELQEFIDDVSGDKPKSAADWLVAYLPCIQTIYAIQILASVDTGDGWAAVHAVQGLFWNAGGGVLQADGEGFSNEDGYHILWQFSDSAKGAWRMAVLNQDGSWTRFEMDLGRKDHRASFLDGRVPRNVTLL